MAQNKVVRGTATKIARGIEANGDSIVACSYHGTAVGVRSGNTVTLNSGGYRTATTKTRMNQFANEFCDGQFTVSQSAGVWTVHLWYAARDANKEAASLPFVDGMTFHVKG